MDRDHCSMTRFIFILYALIATASLLHAQRDSVSDLHESLNERLFEYGGQDAEASPMLDDLDELARSPLNLNAATLQQLSALPFLSPPAAYALYAERRKSDGFADWDQIAAVRGIDEDALIYLRLYTYLPKAESGIWDQGLSVQLRSRFEQDDRPRLGYLDGSYAGSALKSYQRVSISNGNRRQAGLLIEKDAGEASFADHLTGYLRFDSTGFLDRIVIGDFTMNAGQGLVLWRASGASKSGEVISSGKRRAEQIHPFLSATESRHMRGIAMQTRAGMFTVSGFYSVNRIDARIDSLTGDITSFDESGLHRTSGESSHTNTVSDRGIGGRVSTEAKLGLSLVSGGFTGITSQLDHVSVPSTPFGFAGSSASAFSLDADIQLPGTDVFMEWARSHTGCFGGIVGMTTHIGPRMAGTLLYRTYQPNFVSRSGFAFGERNGATQNEEGFYLGLQCTVFRGLIVQASFDSYRFPARTYQIPVPSSGHDFFARVDWKVTRGLSLTLSFKQDTKDDVANAIDQDGRDIRPVTQKTRRNIRLDCRFSTGPRIVFRSRFETAGLTYAMYNEPEDGYLFFVDAQYAPAPALKIVARAAAYRTDSYETRLYMYESSLRGSFANAGYYGQGMRMSLFVQLSPASAVSFGFKYGQTISYGAGSTGSGKDTVNGDTLGKISMQMDLQL